MTLKIKVFWAVTMCLPALPKNAVLSSRTEGFKNTFIKSKHRETSTQQQRHIAESPVRQQIIIIIISSTAVGGPWPPQANVGSDPYPGHPPVSFYDPVSLRRPLPRQSTSISVGHVLVFVNK